MKTSNKEFSGNVIGRIVGFSMQVVGGFMAVGETDVMMPTTGQYMITLAGVLLLIGGVVIYRYFGGEYSLITKGTLK